ncbi:hypothetical protein AB0L40_05450 [Patulibacter sp. NPDC049589]|uniref:hypothetical protein n=1 Tax=Patulibacter sp. NPDC049589 TaxID=3154731 RepID=UPI00341509CD
MDACDTDQDLPRRGEHAVHRLEWVVQVAAAVSLVGCGVSLLAAWADSSCAVDGGLRPIVSVPGGIGYVAAIVVLIAGVLLVGVGLWSDRRGGWWASLLWLVPVIALTGVWLWVAIFSCWG